MQRTLGRSYVRYVTFFCVLAATVTAAVIFRQFELNIPRAPIGVGVEKALDWAIIYLSPALEAIKLVLTKIFVAVELFFLWIPWPVWVVFVGLVGWMVVSLRIGLLLAGGLLLIEAMNLWNEAMSTMSLIGVAVALTVLVAVPIGILASLSNRFEGFARPILDAMQTIPSMVYLIPAVMLLGVGRVPAIAATMIFAIPPAIRLTNLGLRQVPADVKEAARSFGASKLQLLMKVEIPLALRTIMAGVNQATMMSVSMVVIAAFIGAGGLGYSVLYALDRVRIGAGIEAGLAILAIAIILDRLTQAFAKPRQLRAKIQNKPG